MIRYSSKSLFLFVVVAATVLVCVAPYLKFRLSENRLAKFDVQTRRVSGGISVSLPKRGDQSDQRYKELLGDLAIAAELVHCTIGDGWNIDDILNNFRDLSGLRELSVTSSNAVNPTNWPNLPSLKRLSVAGNSTVFFGVNERCCPERLLLRGVKIQDLVHGNCAKLDSLVVEDSDLEMVAAEQFRTLRSISVVNCEFDFGLMLEASDLEYCLVSQGNDSVSLDFLSAHTNLIDLIARRPKSLTPAHGLRKLKSLDISFCNISDQDSEWISGLEDLESLVLNKCTISTKCEKTIEELEQRGVYITIVD